jgi:hypothetical protein
VPTDKIIIDGIPTAVPGSKVSPHEKPIAFVADKGQDGAGS